MFNNDFDPYQVLVNNTDSIPQLARAYNQMQEVIANLTQEHNEVVKHLKIAKNQIFLMNNEIARLREELASIKNS